MTSTLGVPAKLLHDALGHVITVELRQGSFIEENWPKVGLECMREISVAHSAFVAEDSLNISLRDITVTCRDGRVTQLLNLNTLDA